VRPYCFGDMNFVDHAIDLSVIVSLLPLVVEVGVRASSDDDD
jgi:hypothetical protein